MRLVLKIAYEGGHFGGWQRNPAFRTVQGELEAALAAVGLPGKLQAASRTDRGVHAEGQVAHLKLGKTDRPPDPKEVQRRLAEVLPEDLSVVDAALAPGRFHARWSSRGKVYRYRIAFHEAPRAWRLPDPRGFPNVPPEARLDVEAMRSAARLLRGRRPLRGLASFHSRFDRGVHRPRFMCPVLTVEPDGVVSIYVSGGGFFRHQIRNLVGLLCEVGYGMRDPAEVSTLVERRPYHEGPRAPGWGLTLLRVRYPLPLDPFREPRWQPGRTRTFSGP